MITPKRLIALLAAIISAFIGAFIINLRTHGTLRISTPSSIPRNASVKIEVVRNGNIEQTVELPAGQTKELRLRTGTLRINGVSGHLRAVDIVTIKSGQTTNLTTPQAEQRAIQQVASDALACPFLTDPNTYSYACNGDSQITRHTPNGVGGSKNSLLFKGQIFSDLQPVYGGLLGFMSTSDQAVSMVYIQLPQETIQTVALPGQIASLIATDWPRLVTSGDNSDRFALLFSASNRLYLFNGPGDAAPKQLKTNDVKLNADGQIAAVSFYQDQLRLYVGPGLEGGESEGIATPANEDTSPTHITARLFSYNASGDLKGVLELPEPASTQAVYQLAADFFVADQGEGFSFYHHTAGRLQPVYHIDSMASLAISNGKAYMQVAQSLYEFAPKTNGLFSLHSLFSTADMPVSRAFNTNQGLVFTAYAGTSPDAPLNIYKLLEQKETSALPPLSLREPIYSGFDNFATVGINPSLQTTTKLALTTYAKANYPHISRIQVSDLTTVPHDRNSTSTVSTYLFTVSLDRQQLRANLDCLSPTSLQLYLYDTAGHLVYDSQPLQTQ